VSTPVTTHTLVSDEQVDGTELRLTVSFQIQTQGIYISTLFQKPISTSLFLKGRNVLAKD